MALGTEPFYHANRSAIITDCTPSRRRRRRCHRRRLYRAKVHDLAEMQQRVQDRVKCMQK